METTPPKRQAVEGNVLRPHTTDVAAKGLKESEEGFRATFENAPIGMAVVSLDNHYLQVNQAFCDMIGYTQE